VDNNKYNTHEVKCICENKLRISFKGTKELNGYFKIDGKNAARITVAKGRKDIPPKTYKSMASQLCLDVDQFDKMLVCDMKPDEYESIIRSKKS
jgi:hypothetical protein